MTELDAAVKKTSTWMGKVIKKPPMKSKLLQKPPFRFLFDVVMEVTRSTGMLDGLFTPDELDPERVKEKAGKIHFLTKAIKATALTCGEALSAKPSKIVAGQEPEKTNEWLQALAKCCIKKYDSRDAVNQVLSGASEETKPADPPAAEKDKPPPPRPTNDKGRRGKRPGKAGSSARGGRSVNQEVIDSTAQNGPIEQQAHTSPEENVALPPPQDEGPDESQSSSGTDSQRPSAAQRPQSRGRNALDAEGRGGRSDRPSSARRGQRRQRANDVQPSEDASQAAEEAAIADKNVEHAEVNDLPDPKERQDSVRKSEQPVESQNRRPRPATSRRAKTGVVEEASMDEPVEVVGLMTEGDNDDGDDDTFEVVEAPEPQAPRRTPLEGHDDDGEEVHGSLMRSIQEKKGSESITAVKTSSAAEVAKMKQRKVVSEEVNQLREAIQQLCRSANPLGKVVDYIQEDCDAMQSEVVQWNEEHRGNVGKIITESATIETELQQARLKLDELNRQIDDQEEMIRAVKATTFDNDARIQRLLSGISFSSGM